MRLGKSSGSLPPISRSISGTVSAQRRPAYRPRQSSSVQGDPSSVMNSASTRLASTSLSAITPSKSKSIARMSGWQQYSQNRAGWRVRLHLDLAAMGERDLARQAKPDTEAVLFGGEKRHANIVQRFRGQ